MWGSLKSDLQELVSVVTEDTNVVLEKIQDEKKVKQATAALREAERRMMMEETYLVPLLPTEEEGDTELEEDRPKIEEFLKDFDLESKTDQISELLEAYPDSLKLHFEELVPQVVRYEIFWERFFFRCDEDRIQGEWDEEEARAQKARAELVGSVSNFFGGAAKAVASGVATVATAATTDTGRPPFVLNTAVSEDGEEEEDEEFGWGDEDDEEVSEGEEETPQNESLDTVDEGSEQIVFRDEALETTQAELKQALEERDQLKETIELQKKEIGSLRNGPTESSEVDSLRETLAQKEKEIATLRESASSLPVENNEAPLLAKIESMSHDISAKDTKISELEQLRASECKDFMAQIEELKAENKSVQDQLAEATAEATQQQDKLAADVQSSQNRVASLTAELKAAKAQAKADQELMRSELEQLRARNEKESDATLDSGESGVKLTKPAVSKLSVGDDEEDDWGDDWD